MLLQAQMLTAGASGQVFTLIPAVFGRVDSTNANYAAMVAGSGLSASSGLASYNVGQGAGYFAAQVFLSFDTSGVPSASIVSARVSLGIAYDVSDTDFDITACAIDFGPSVETGDWQQPSTLGALAVGATSTAGMGSTVSIDIPKTAIGASVTRLVLTSSRVISETVPAGNEFIGVQTPQLIILTG